jgi:hypothetical protein
MWGKLTIVLLIFLLLIVQVPKTQTATQTQTYRGPAANIELTLNVVDIDSRIDTLTSSNYALVLDTLGQNGTPIRGLLLSSDVNLDTGFTEAKEFTSLLTSDPSIGETPNPWSLVANRLLDVVSFPTDSYSLYFLIGLNTSLDFLLPTITPILPLSLNDSWTYQTSFSPLSGTPTNKEISSWGLSPQEFALYSAGVTNFYLLKINFENPMIPSVLEYLVYIIPASLLLAALLYSIKLVYRNILKISDAAAIYLGSAFFALTFLAGILPNASLRVVSFQEILLVSDVILSLVLMILSLYKHRKRMTPRFIPSMSDAGP